MINFTDKLETVLNLINYNELHDCSLGGLICFTTVAPQVTQASGLYRERTLLIPQTRISN